MFPSICHSVWSWCKIITLAMKFAKCSRHSRTKVYLLILKLLIVSLDKIDFNEVLFFLNPCKNI